MNDTIVQEVRDIRAAIAEKFGYDRTRIIAWAREQTKQRKAALSAAPGKAVKATDTASPAPATKKRRVRLSRAIP